MSSRDSDLDDTPKAKPELRKLDGILPESMDRRKFLTGTVATTVGLLAGCTGGEGNSQGTTTTSSDVTWRTAWKATPNYVPSYIAQTNGFWKDQNITPPTPKAGNGSGDTARRIGTGQESLGMGSMIPVASGLAEDYNLSIYGTAKARSQVALLYRTDRLQGPKDIQGKNIVSASALNTQAWPIYASAVGHPDVSIGSAEESAAAAQLVSGDVDAMFDTINDFGSLKSNVEAQSGASVAAEPLYAQVSVIGYPLYVNNDWLAKDGNLEYTVRAMSGYSEAVKWTLLNPEEAIKIMQTDVNKALKTEKKDVLLSQMAAGVAATNLTDSILKNGVGYLEKSVLSSSLTELAKGLGVKETSVKDAANFEIQKKAELATLSSDEQSQVREFAQPYIKLFE